MRIARLRPSLTQVPLPFPPNLTNPISLVSEPLTTAVFKEPNHNNQLSYISDVVLVWYINYIKHIHLNCALQVQTI